MQHRHLEEQGLTLAVIDDVIERGGIEDWIRLGRRALEEPRTLEAIRRLAGRTVSTSERPDRPMFWVTFCERHSIPDRSFER